MYNRSSKFNTLKILILYLNFIVIAFRVLDDTAKLKSDSSSLNKNKKL